MRTIIVGAGAVGSVIGGRLAQMGADVVLVARPPHASAIAEHGLIVRSGDHDDTIAVRAVTSLTDILPGSNDVVIITAKTQDVAAIHDDIHRWNPDVAVVCGTNGVEHERMALRRFARTSGMVIQLPSTFARPGVVTALCLPTNALLDVGCYPNGVDSTVRELATTLDASPFVSCEADPAVMVKKYEKVIVNLGNAAEAACGLQGRGHEVSLAAMAEAREVYRVAGITFEIADPVDRARYDERRSTMKFVVPPGETFLGGSTWQGLAKGSASVETDYFNGEIVLLGRIHGVATPHNSFLQRLARDLATSGAGPASMTPDQLSARWHAAIDQ